MSYASLAEEFSALPLEERRKRLESLSGEESRALFYDWSFWRRANQAVPAGNWRAWIVMSGRGWGKTRVGSETVRGWVRDFEYVNIIGPTAADARDVMIEGESGILNICPVEERPEYVQSRRLLRWPNGARSLIFSADEPERLRGPQHMKLWCDEIGAWRYDDSWTQAMFGLRLGRNPQAVVTTTPKPRKFIRDLLAGEAVVITKGSTYENKQNLAKAFLGEIISRYEGTHLGRQEIYAELIDEIQGALWSRKLIDDTRLLRRQVPELKRIVVAIDPSGSTTNEAGIAAAGIGGCPIDWPCKRHGKLGGRHLYILDDASLLASRPMAWASAAVALYYKHNADRIVGERNYGGDMVQSTVRTVDAEVPYNDVDATRGKTVRAEPIMALYEQGVAHHVGYFAQLEDEMCEYVPGESKSPNRMDAMVWAATELFGKPQGILEWTQNQAAAQAKLLERPAVGSHRNQAPSPVSPEDRAAWSREEFKRALRRQ